MPLVLLFDDIAPQPFPFNRVVASKITQNFGSTFAKELTYNRSSQVADAAQSPSTSHHAFILKNDNVDEIGRQTFILNDDNTSTAVISTLTTVNGAPVIANALQLDSEQMVVNGSTVIAKEGVSFSDSEAAIFFGDQKQFKIAYNDGEFTIQARNPDDGSYTKKICFTN
jgi:hypothetical protein